MGLWTRSAAISCGRNQLPVIVAWIGIADAIDGSE